MKGRKLMRGVYWQGALKQKVLRELGRKIMAACIAQERSDIQKCA
jgi:hypothetical protein